MSALETTLAAARAEGRPLIAAHRGTPGGIVSPNTVMAAKCALASGADIVELDVARSTDGIYFGFHDTYEERLIGAAPRLTTLDSTQIETYQYLPHEGKGCGSIERYSEILGGIGNCLVNVDRSYRYWPDGFLDQLAQWADPTRMLIKCLAKPEQLQALSQNSDPYLFMGVANKFEDVDKFLAKPDSRLFGLELNASDPDDYLISAEFIKQLHDQGLLVWLNAINLENGIPLCGGMDDATALAGDPDNAWGALANRGADIIQTDWPWLVKAYFDNRTAKTE